MFQLADLKLLQAYTIRFLNLKVEVMEKDTSVDVQKHFHRHKLLS